MGLLSKLFGGAKENIEEKRWGWVAPRFEHGEERVGTTPTWILGGPQPVGGHVFLTTRKMYVAGTQPPFGSEDDPFVVEVRIESISRLLVSDNGILATVNPNSRGEDVSNMLDLYPSPISRQLLGELRGRWVEATGGEPEGDWSLWLAEDAPMVERSARNWAQGPVSS